MRYIDNTIYKKSGQSLVEVLIAMAVSTVLLGAALQLLTTSFTIDVRSKDIQNATFLAQQLMDDVVALSDDNWYAVYSLEKNGTQYSVVVDEEETMSVIDGVEEVTRGGKKFERYFTVENVSREAFIDEPEESSYLKLKRNFALQSVFALWRHFVYSLIQTTFAAIGNIEHPYNPDNDDPGTQKITVVVSWSVMGGGNPDKSISLVRYITSHNTFAFHERMWNGGDPGLPGGTFEAISGTVWTSASSPNGVCAYGGFLLLDGAVDPCGPPFRSTGSITSETIDTGVPSPGATMLYTVWHGLDMDGASIEVHISTDNGASWTELPVSDTPGIPAGDNIQIIASHIQVRITFHTSNPAHSIFLSDLIIHWVRGSFDEGLIVS